MLEVINLSAHYGPAQVVRGVSFTVGAGEIVAVVGPNGAGKSTIAQAVCGVHAARSGIVRLHDRDLSALGAVDIARAGLTLVPQGRRVFGSLTVDEHLQIAGIRRRPGGLSRDELLELFPPLRKRLRVRARSLSGGEQQMLAITRAVLLGPDVLVLDEPTEGLAPSVVGLVGALMVRLAGRRVGMLLLEQSRGFPFEVAHRVLAIDRGVLTGQIDSDDSTGAVGQAVPHPQTHFASEGA